MRLARLLPLLVLGCAAKTGSPPPRTAPAVAAAPTAPALACPADHLPPLTTHIAQRRCDAAPDRCRAACARDDHAACFALAYDLELSGRADDATALWRRGCELGLANACTNYGAHLWARAGTADAVACARRLFEATCATGDHFACGMTVRLLVEESDDPEVHARGLVLAERHCASPGGFACRVLALYLERGALGPVEPDRVPALLERACRTGDDAACGAPATATETFH